MPRRSAAAEIVNVNDIPPEVMDTNVPNNSRHLWKLSRAKMKFRDGKPGGLTSKPSPVT